jgi:hypothetical protein
LSTSTPFSSASRRFLHPTTSAVLPSAVTLKRDAFCRDSLVYTSQDISYWFSSSLWRSFVSYASTFNDSILVFFLYLCLSIFQPVPAPNGTWIRSLKL